MTRLEILHSVVDALQDLAGSPVTETLAQELLQPGADIDIRALGLESLDAVEWCMQIETRTGVDIDPATYSNLERLSDLVSIIEKQSRTAKPAATPVVSAPGAPSPLSFSQERIWTYCQHPAAAASYIAEVLNPLRGPLDVELLRTCLQRLVDRHEILRTVFRLVHGKPVQVIQPAKVECELHQLASGAEPLTEARRIAASMAKGIQDLQRGPLARFALLRVNEDEHWLIRSWHHLLCDVESSLLFMGEVAELYDAACRNRPPVLAEPDSYADFVASQRETYARGTPAWQESLAWYETKFATPSNFRGPPLRRGIPKPDAAIADAMITGACANAETASRLEALREKSGATTFVLWLAATTALMSLDGERDIVVGTYVTQRRRAKFQHTLGDFTGFVALRLNCDPKLPFGAWLSAVQNELSAAERHSGPPYEDIIAELRASQKATPDVQMTFGSYTNLRLPKAVQGIEFSRVRPPPQLMPWGFVVTLNDTEDGICPHARFDATIYDPALVSAFVDRLGRFLDAASRDPQSPLEKLV